MAFDIAKFLGELGFDGTAVAELAPKFTADAVTKLEAGYMNRTNYDTFRAQLEDTNDRLNREMAEWGALKNKDSEAAQLQAAEIEKLRIEKVQLTSRLTDVATRAGLDPKTVLPAEPTTTTAPVSIAPPFDPSKFVDRSDLSQMVPVLLNTPVEYQAIAADHHRLFGTELNGDEIRKIHQTYMTRASKKEDVDPKRVWEEMFQVPARREQVAKDKYDADIKAAEERGAERSRSEAVLPNAHPVGAHAPVFRSDAKGQPRESLLQRPQPGRQTLGFAQALREGRYRSPQQRPAGAAR